MEFKDAVVELNNQIMLLEEQNHQLCRYHDATVQHFRTRIHALKQKNMELRHGYEMTLSQLESVLDACRGLNDLATNRDGRYQVKIGALELAIVHVEEDRARAVRIGLKEAERAEELYKISSSVAYHYAGISRRLISQKTPIDLGEDMEDIITADHDEAEELMAVIQAAKEFIEPLI